MLRRYCLAIGLVNLVWEFVQMPLYTVWRQGSLREIVWAAIHCTVGDLLIAAATLLGALIVAGREGWPSVRFGLVATIAILGGLAWVILSEWINTEIRGSWAYSAWMPTLPLIGTGLAPVIQWLVIPPVAFWWARRGVFAAQTGNGEKS